MSNKTVAGFGDKNANGTYVESGTMNAYPRYLKGDNYMMVYRAQYMPYSYSTGYYIEKIVRIPGNANTQVVPCYKVEGTSPTASGWFTLRGKDSGEQQCGIVS